MKEDGTAPDVPAAPQALRVLLIDDNEDVRWVVSIQLENFFLVEDVGSVADAVARVAEGRRYDAVICDLVMPGGGAERWLAACESLDPQLAERTLFMTGGAVTPHDAALLASRRDRVLQKPVELDVLLRAIRCAATR